MKKWLLALIIAAVLITGIAVGIVVTKVSNIVKLEKQRTPDAITYNRENGKNQLKKEEYPKTEKTEESKFIGEEKAKEIAILKAEIKESDVNYIIAKLDRDDAVWQYEVEFRKGNIEYSADIRATDGKILEWDVDRD